MKKKTKGIWKRLISLALCTAMVIGIVLECGMIQTRAAGNKKLAGCSLTVSEGAIGMNLFVSGLSDEEAKQYKLVVDGVSHSFSEKQKDGSYKATHFVTPRNIPKKLSIALYSGNTKIALANESAENGVLFYSVNDYLGNLKNENSPMGRLAKSLYDYGACAYYYFNGYGEIPGEAGVQIRNVDLSAYKMKTSEALIDGISYAGSCLVLGDTIAIRHYFDVTKQFDSLVLIVDGQAVEAKPDPDQAYRYYVEIDNVRAWDIGYAYKLTVVANKRRYTMSYSALTYAYVADKNNVDQMLCDLVKSIYWYKVAFDECYDSQEITLPYVTYRMFNAKGDGVTDDYDAIIRTHDFANKHNLPVKADEGATYYIGHMNPNKPKGALIKTETDWDGATFVINDKSIVRYVREYDVMTEEGLKTMSEVVLNAGECFLFTVEPSKECERKFFNTAKGDTLGLDPNLSDYKEFHEMEGDYATYDSNDYEKVKTLLNKTILHTTMQLETTPEKQFKEKALYVLQDQYTRRWGRHGSMYASNQKGSPQMEVVIVNTDGSIDEATPLQWDWYKMDFIWKYPIDETLLTVNGGTFITDVNDSNAGSYIHRGIAIVRSNVLMQNVTHLLTGEEAQFNENSKVVNSSTGEVKYYARLGAPYQGFFRLDHCAYVTLKNCVFSNHLRAFSKGDNVNGTAPYDYYAEFAAVITLDACTCAPDKDDLTGPGDETGILDDWRWGTTGTNFCKQITVQNGCWLNRIDAHQGTYNLTVKNSVMGTRGIAAVGFGELVVEDVLSYADYFFTLRNDFGSAWYGNVTVRNSTWILDKNNWSPRLFNAKYDPTLQYFYEPFEEDGKTYYSTLPEKITIDGFTLDASKVENAAICNGGLAIYTNVLSPVQDMVDNEYLNDPERYKFPVRPTKEVVVRGLKVLKNKNNPAKGFFGVKIQAVDNSKHRERLFEKYNENTGNFEPFYVDFDKTNSEHMVVEIVDPGN
ncbi:MAG: hypothetical protein K6F51_09380 [Acetatifactor sp.]|nr:hypothetical protein [Acetatifactor sp.]